MNVVALIGNVATEPEIRTTAAGRRVCTFRLAISRPGGEFADFFTVVTWERQAEVCAEYLTIGRRVSVEGRLHQSTWEVEGGERRSACEVVASRVGLLGVRREHTPEPAEDAQEVGA
jgi:single-strand DNA-binding protein